MATGIETKPFSDFNPPDGRLYWYRQGFKKDETGLVWQMTAPTYDMATHTKGLEKYEIDFPQYNITDPVLARAIIALRQMHVTSMSALKDILTSEKNCLYSKNKSHPFIEVLERASGKELLHDQTYAEMGTLTGAFAALVFQGFSFPDYFDQAVKTPDKQKGLNVVDAFVEFYNGSRSMTVAGAKDEATRYLSTHAEIDLDDVSQANFPSSFTNENTHPLRLAKIRALIETVATARYALDPIYIHQSSDNVVIDSNVVLTDNGQTNLKKRYAIEVRSGLRLLLKNKKLHGIDSSTVTAKWDKSGEVNIVDRIFLKDLTTGDILQEHSEYRPPKEVRNYNWTIRPGGRCPFFHQSYSDPTDI